MGKKTPCHELKPSAFTNAISWGEKRGCGGGGELSMLPDLVHCNGNTKLSEPTKSHDRDAVCFCEANTRSASSMRTHHGTEPWDETVSVQMLGHAHQS
jgi:hypothetical protein